MAEFWRISPFLAWFTSFGCQDNTRSARNYFERETRVDHPHKLNLYCSIKKYQLNLIFNVLNIQKNIYLSAVFKLFSKSPNDKRAVQYNLFIRFTQTTRRA